MPLRRAYSRQAALTGQSAQMRRAISTPTPSLGKNTEGGSVRHRPLAIHGSVMRRLPPRVPSPHLNGQGDGDGSLSLTTSQASPDDASLDDRATREPLERRLRWQRRSSTRRGLWTKPPSCTARPANSPPTS